MNKTTQKQELVKRENVETTSLISQAIEKGLPVETMERLFALHERQKANFAREEYVKALSEFQRNCPVIGKTKKVMNKDGRTVRYQYAPLEGIIEQIKNSLSSNGLSYKWEVENRDGFIKATAIITHIAGHSESSSFEVPVDKEGFMTAPQKYASALTFAKRYSLTNSLGIATAEEDTDATDVNKEPDPKSIRSKIIFSLRALGYEPNKWDKKEWSEKIKELTEIELSEKNFDEIYSRLNVLVQEKNEDKDIQE